MSHADAALTPKRRLKAAKLVGAVSGGVEGAVAVVVGNYGGVLGIGLGVADLADGAALDPAGGVQAGDDGATEIGRDVAFVVGDDGFRAQNLEAPLLQAALYSGNATRWVLSRVSFHHVQKRLRTTR